MINDRTYSGLWKVDREIGHPIITFRTKTMIVKDVKRLLNSITKVRANGLGGGAPVYSVYALLANLVRFQARGPLSILFPSLHPGLSCPLDIYCYIQ